MRAPNTLVSGSRATNAAAPAARISRCRVRCAKARSRRSEASKSACLAVHDSTRASNCDGVIAYAPSGYGAGAGTASGAGSNAPPTHITRFSPRNGFTTDGRPETVRASGRASRPGRPSRVRRTPPGHEGETATESRPRADDTRRRSARAACRELRSASVPLALVRSRPRNTRLHDCPPSFLAD